ncbi:MAG: thiamine phosphate synthase [Gemmatimonadales bacterium]
MGDNVARLVRLMLVTDDKLVRGRDLVMLALAGERGGVTSLQLRLKQAAARELAQLVRALRQALQIPIIVNDRPDVALAAGAAGVHLGPEDLPVELVRRIAPPGFIVGASVGSPAEAVAAAAADYWGIGPWRVTATKDDAGPGLGPEGFKRLRRLAGEKPSIAVGGVLPDDVPAILAAGGKGLAVAAGILGEEDVEEAARRYRTVTGER